MNFLLVSEITDFFSFVWSVISGLVDTIKNVIKFIYELITIIPTFLDFLPNEIKIIFIPIITLVFIVFIYNFIK